MHRRQLDILYRLATGLHVSINLRIKISAIETAITPALLQGEDYAYVRLNVSGPKRISNRRFPNGNNSCVLTLSLQDLSENATAGTGREKLLDAFDEIYKAGNKAREYCIILTFIFEWISSEYDPSKQVPTWNSTSFNRLVLLTGTSDFYANGIRRILVKADDFPAILYDKMKRARMTMQRAYSKAISFILEVPFDFSALGGYIHSKS
ncbi:hypothetical protein D9757_010173 [Collybiopsis confluens]|uniref:Uncharacterized protein n=1 Tax=Collybiopsis confluens TaxID=2823264 RepID=A0A8H5H0P8_9AGAR|nr:hypothetical protein D9757_010173 [Collybiopsis confluens]